MLVVAYHVRADAGSSLKEWGLLKCARVGYPTARLTVTGSSPRQVGRQRRDSRGRTGRRTYRADPLARHTPIVVVEVAHQAASLTVGRRDVRGSTPYAAILRAFSNGRCEPMPSERRS